MTTHTPEQLRVAVCEALGWTNIREQDYCEAHVSPYEGHVLQFWQGVDPETGEKDEIPPLTLDLMHEAEATLSDEEHAWDFVKRGPVTCEKCAAVIEACRGVRIKRHP